MSSIFNIGAVSYLNTKPLLYGIERFPFSLPVHIQTYPPAQIATLLLQKKIAVGLSPVSVIPRMDTPTIVSNYCIATDGEVASVCLFGRVPLEEIKFIYLDNQSKTSNALVQLLCQYHWKINPQFLLTTQRSADKINGNTAAVVIGDAALELQTAPYYKYDLGLAWKALTGLGFVFATWISHQPLPSKWIDELNAANQLGIENIDAAIAQNHLPYYDVSIYLKKNIVYEFSSDKQQSLALFLDYLQKNNWVAYK